MATVMIEAVRGIHISISMHHTIHKRGMHMYG